MKSTHEIFSTVCNGSIEIVFRKSLPLELKEKYSNEVVKLLNINAPTRIIKGKGIIYFDIYKDFKNITNKLQSLKDNTLFYWDNHIK
mgnify:CR=1 FL=1